MALKILITGGNGQLGSSLRTEFARREGLAPCFVSHSELDITDAQAIERVMSREGFDVIVNCAAYTNVDGAESERELASLINGEAPRLLAEAAARHGAKMIHISTDYVFDGLSREPYTEEDMPNPISHYGASKLEGERKVLAALPSAIVIRTSWLYSARRGNFVSAILSRAAESGTLRVVDDQTGSPTFAPDLAAAIARIVQSESPTPGIYHYANRGAISRYRFAQAILQMAGKLDTCKVIPVKSSEYPTPATRPTFSALSTAKIERTFGLEIPDWDTSLARCINELNDNNITNDY